MADERHPPVRQLAAGGRLPDVVQQGGEAKRLPPRELVGERLLQDRTEARRELRAEGGLGLALDLQESVQHLHRVVVDIEVVEVALLHAVEGGDLGQNRLHQAQPVGQRQALEHPVRGDQPAELGEHPLGRREGNPWRGLSGEPLRLRIGPEAELGGETGQPQRAQRVARVGGVLDGGTAEHPQHAALEVRAAPGGVDQAVVAARLLERHRERVHAEVALSQVLLDGRPLEWRDVADPTAPHGAPGPEGLGQRKHRAAGGLRHRPGGLLRGALHGEVHVAHRTVEQGVAHAAPHHPGAVAALRERVARGAHRRRLAKAIQGRVQPSRGYALSTRPVSPQVTS